MIIVDGGWREERVSKSEEGRLSAVVRERFQDDVHCGKAVGAIATAEAGAEASLV